MIHSNLKETAFILSAALLSTTVRASDYHFGIQPVSAQDTANATAAKTADTSAIFYNPAGLSKIDSSQISVNASIVFPGIHYEVESAKRLRTSANISDSTSGKITETTVVPHAYGAYKASDDVTLGLGVYVPFDSATEYEKDSVLRYNINKLGLATIVIEPVITWKLNEQHAVGAGLITQYSRAELRKYSDWNASGAINQLASGLTSRQAGRPVAVDATGEADGHAGVKGHDWGFGYQLAWMWDTNNHARADVNYRSKVSYTLKGTTDWEADGACAKHAWDLDAMAARGYTPNEKVSVGIVTPESSSVRDMYHTTDKANLFGDVTWARHSRFNKTELVFENTRNVINGKPDRTVITPNRRNTYKVAFGDSYQVTGPLQLRIGIAFDKSPVRNTKDRMNSLPNGNRIWLSVGAKYQLGKNRVIDTAYSHIHINGAVYHTGKAGGNGVDSRSASSARFKNKADILGLQYTYKFK